MNGHHCRVEMFAPIKIVGKSRFFGLKIETFFAIFKQKPAYWTLLWRCDCCFTTMITGRFHCNQQCRSYLAEQDQQTGQPTNRERPSYMAWLHFIWSSMEQTITVKNIVHD